MAMDIARKREMKSIYLLTNRTGRKLRTDGVQSAMARLKKKMIEEGHGRVFWTLHDLKRKVITDVKDDRIAGHRSEKMRQRYNLKIESFEPPK